MLFPKTSLTYHRLIIGIGLGIAITAAIIALMGLNERNELSALGATATPTKTATKKATPTATASPTALPTQTPTSTPSPTNTPTATHTPTPTPTSTNTPWPPTFTPTFTPVISDVLAMTNATAITGETSTSITTTLEITGTTPLSGTGVISPAGTPTPTPTPVPRSVLAPAIVPDYTKLENHFWFTRPFTEAFNSWGSYYYPYGTNARGQYFWHYGIDIAGAHGTPIVAVADGRVIHAGPDDEANLLGPWPDFYGQAVVVEHDRRWNNQPLYTLYGHVSKVHVQVGQQVRTGDMIAEVGQLGVAIGPHLHLEVRVGAGTYFDTRNPDLWVRSDPGFGVIAGRVVDHQGYFVPQQLVTLHRLSQPSRFWRQTFTYPDNVVNSDDGYIETFTFSDVPAGQYLLKTFFDGRQVTVPVTVTNGATSFALLHQTEPPLPSQPSAPRPATPAVDISQEENPPPETNDG